MVEEFYKSKLEAIGYDFELHYRRGLDAVLIGWKRDAFRLVSKKELEHEDLIERYPDFAKDFKRGNVGLICLLEHTQTK
jgi:hypothetical protein